MMKVLLIRPVINTIYVTPPLGLAWIATALRKNNHQVEIIDCPKQKIMDWKTFKNVLEKKSFDVVGMSAYTLDLDNIKIGIKHIKQVNPNAKIVIGGPHPSSMPHEAFFDDKIDFAFKGESEIGFPQLIDYIDGKKIKLDKIPGLIWKKDGNLVINEQLFLENLDELGIPAWDLIPPNEYPQAPHGGFAKRFPVAPIIVSRGCPYTCTFCAVKDVVGLKMRYRGIDIVIEELKLLKEKYGVKEFHIEDDNFTMNRLYVKKFCERLIEEKINLPWFCASGLRIDSLNEKLLTVMKQSGCYTASVAIESGDNKILEDMKKQLTVETVREKVRLLKRVGFEVKGFFIIGFPTDTKETINRTIKFALELPLDGAQFGNYIPLPGTESYNKLKASGELENLDYSKLHTASVPYVPKGMTTKDLKNLQRYAFLRFYLRPRILIHNLRQVRSLGHFKALTKRLTQYLGVRA